MSFNKSQSIAIKHNTGPMLVLAGPGSGKTTVITNRTKYLIEHYGVNPSNILVITFTKAAAKEMKERFFKLMGNERLPVSFGTFHGVFFAILKYAYNLSSDNVVREEQKRNCIKEIIETLDIEIEDENDFINDALSEISIVKNERINPDNYYPRNFSKDIFSKIYGDYTKYLKKARLLDFDDMLVYCYELFKERKDILKAWQKKYKYILIDEFQDINYLQYDIIKMLALPENNLFIVGDDDQSIYRFRGAKPKIMLDFNKDYPDFKKVLLDINYRSTANIVETSKKLIGKNSERYIKDIKAVKDAGDKVDVRLFENQEEENKYIINILLEAHRNKKPYRDYAVIYRTNTQPRRLIQRVMENNIPFRIRDSLPNIFEHWIARNIFAYIRVAMGSRDRGDFLQIINRPNRYISRACLDKKFITFDDMREFYSDKNWMRDRIDKLEYDLEMISTMSPYAAINYIIKGVEYEKYLKEYARFRKIGDEELLENLNEILLSAKGYNTFDEWFKYIDEYSRKLNEQINNNDDNPDSVCFMTMHSSKGLEFKNVIVIDANEGIMPHNKAILEADIEEERRLFYVALTRTKENLHVFSVKERYSKKLKVSRFVEEMIK